ncbi:MAG: FHA domain-containing protein [Cyanobium sp. M30B3]|nr:MAG: FHA domain-containing protein [Cyanobium sp. M30B3]
MTATATLHLRDEPQKCLRLNPDRPLTIGRASGNQLALPTLPAVADHHAVVRFSSRHGWLVCDWQSSDGTYLEEERVLRCRPLGDGDEIRLGRSGPVLVFRLQQKPPGIPPPPLAPPPLAAVSRSHGSRAATVAIGGESIHLDQIRSVMVYTVARFPQLFSWWVLLSVALLLLLPIRIGPVWIFWPLQLVLLAAAVLLGSRKRHTLQVDLRDGQVRRHPFSNRRTALAHRNGIRQAISPGADPVQASRAR